MFILRPSPARLTVRCTPQRGRFASGLRARGFSHLIAPSTARNAFASFSDCTASTENVRRQKVRKASAAQVSCGVSMPPLSVFFAPKR